MTENGLAGKTVLVVEDEYFAAIDLCLELQRLREVVVGPTPSLGKALDLIRSTPHIDGAVLDINLGGEMVFPAADLLGERGVPFLFTTGYDRSMIPPRFSGVLRCEKPVIPDRLSQALASIISKNSATG